MEYTYTDPYLLELLKEAAENERKAADMFENMQEGSPYAPTLKKIASDERKHAAMFEEIFSQLSSMEFTRINRPRDNAVTASANTDIVKQKTENVELYRTMYFALKQHKHKNYVFEILTDEQNHGLLLQGML